MSLVRLAVAQQAVGFYPCFEDWADAQAAFVGQAAADAGGVDMAVLPEYGSMALASVLGAAIYGDLHAQLDALQALRDDYLAVYRGLARTHGIYILAGSFPVRLEGGGYRNRAYFCAPDGGLAYQDKIQMTRFEREDWDIGGSDALSVFDTAHGPVGVAICYDIEFPLIARQQVEAGALLILCPSCTDTRAGYERVRLGARARAMENQVFVAQSPTVGRADWSPAVDLNIGRAALYGPVDRGFPDDGVVAESDAAEGTGAWLHVTLDLDGLARVRQDGQVRNHRDWPGQGRIRACTRRRL